MQQYFVGPSEDVSSRVPLQYDDQLLETTRLSQTGPRRATTSFSRTGFSLTATRSRPQEPEHAPQSPVITRLLTESAIARIQSTAQRIQSQRASIAREEAEKRQLDKEKAIRHQETTRRLNQPAQIQRRSPVTTAASSPKVERTEGVPVPPAKTNEPAEPKSIMGIDEERVATICQEYRRSEKERIDRITRWRVECPEPLPMSRQMEESLAHARETGQQRKQQFQAPKPRPVVASRSSRGAVQDTLPARKPSTQTTRRHMTMAERNEIFLQQAAQARQEKKREEQQRQRLEQMAAERERQRREATLRRRKVKLERTLMDHEAELRATQYAGSMRTAVSRELRGADGLVAPREETLYEAEFPSNDTVLRMSMAARNVQAHHESLRRRSSDSEFSSTEMGANFCRPPPVPTRLTTGDQAQDVGDNISDAFEVDIPGPSDVDMDVIQESEPQSVHNGSENEDNASNNGAGPDESLGRCSGDCGDLCHNTVNSNENPRAENIISTELITSETVAP